MKKFAFKDTLTEKIVKASFGLVIINLLGKVFGYGEKLLLAKYFGTSYEVDVYTVVITIVFSFFYFFREVIEPGFLLVFTEKSESNKETEKWSIFNFGLRIILFSTILLTFLIYLFPAETIKIFAPGFKAEKFILASKLLKTSILACVFLSVSTLTGIILNAQKKFVLPASGDLLFKIVIIVSFFVIDFKQSILPLGIVLIIASLSKLIIHLTGLFSKLSFKKIALVTKDKKRILKLSLPLLAGVIFSQLSGIIDNGFASQLQEGAIASISYAKKIIELPIVMLPYVLSVVLFPFFSELFIQKKIEKLHKVFTNSIVLIVILFLPLSIFFVLNNYEIVELIFKRGAFDEKSVNLTSSPLLIYSYGLLVFAIETILVIYYFSNANTKTPVVIGIVCVIINIVLTWLFIKRIGYLSIPLAYVIQKCIKCLWLVYLKKDDLIRSEVIQKQILIFLVGLSSFIILGFSLKYLNQKILLFDNHTLDNLIKLSLSFVIPFGCYLFLLWKGKIINISKLLTN